jgi:hypothetical protein
LPHCHAHGLHRYPVPQARNFARLGHIRNRIEEAMVEGLGAISPVPRFFLPRDPQVRAVLRHLRQISAASELGVRDVRKQSLLRDYRINQFEAAHP